MARRSPTARDKVCVPPAPGIRPSVTSVSANRAAFTAYAKSQPSSISSPPAKAWPLAAAITGTGHSINALNCSSMMTCCAIHCASLSVLRSLRSAPAQKARSPAPVSTMQRGSSSLVASSCHSDSRSRIIWVLNAFATSGRFNVTRSTCGAGVSVRMV
ncbi:MAG TPA: hypothetical protein VHX19_05815 [Stellaceae bacterium]|nr:hypothetical protein [Stellaceae bacterium]